jgi:hypothetical protein
MAHLGEFGQQVADFEGEADTFSFHGEVFEVPARLSSLVLMRFADAAKRAQDQQEDARARRAAAQAALGRAVTDGARDAAAAEASAADYAFATAETSGTAAMYRFVRECIGEDQWARFEAHAVRVGAGQEELLAVAGAIYQAVSGRPTRRPSDSSGGPSSTGVGSMDGAGSPVATPGPSPLPEASVGQVVELTEAARQRAEFATQMRPVGVLLSGG